MKKAQLKKSQCIIAKKKKIEENINYKIKKETNYLEIEKAVEMEEYYVHYYKKKGFKILNLSKSGSLGYC